MWKIQINAKNSKLITFTQGLKRERDPISLTLYCKQIQEIPPIQYSGVALDKNYFTLHGLNMGAYGKSYFYYLEVVESALV